jgi:hypothetical protein
MKSGKKIDTTNGGESLPKAFAYVRHIGPYAKDEKLFERLINKLCAWAGPRGLLARPDAKMLAVYHDNPDITDEKNLRTDMCLTVPPDTKVDGEIGKSVIPAANMRLPISNSTPTGTQMPGALSTAAGCRKAVISRMTAPASNST